jgi:hypothetical protein
VLVSVSLRRDMYVAVLQGEQIYRDSEWTVLKKRQRNSEACYLSVILHNIMFQKAGMFKYILFLRRQIPCLLLLKRKHCQDLRKPLAVIF